MDKIGITLDEVKSSPLKAEPSPFNPTTEEERAMLRSLIMDSYDWFVGLVAERRAMSRAEVLTLADGSIFTGRQALPKSSSTRSAARTRPSTGWRTKGVDTKLDVVEWKPKKANGLPVLAVRRWTARARLLGLPGRQRRNPPGTRRGPVVP
jgi:protease-4